MPAVAKRKPNKAKWKIEFEKFKEKYLEVGTLYDDDQHWQPRPDDYVMFYYPGGNDYQMYHRLVLCFYDDRIQVLKPDWVCTNMSFKDLAIEHKAGNLPDHFLNDTYYYSDHPDMFKDIIIFK